MKNKHYFGQRTFCSYVVHLKKAGKREDIKDGHDSLPNIGEISILKININHFVCCFRVKTYLAEGY